MTEFEQLAQNKITQYTRQMEQLSKEYKKLSKAMSIDLKQNVMGIENVELTKTLKDTFYNLESIQNQYLFKKQMVKEAREFLEEAGVE